MNETDLEYFITNKHLLTEGKNSASKRSGEFAGLRNHGATCYLNSLIQCLFHDAAFVKLIMEADDNPASVILLELKRLFARLISSTNQTIDTEPLLVAFGWSKSQLFEQHDIHELFSVLLDALSKDSPHVSAGIGKLFQGQMNDTLKCSSCGHESRNATTFLNFSVDMPDGTEGASATACQLQSLLHRHLQPETLDAENKWQCSGCQEKVCATKTPEYQQLPTAVMVHLKRFRYDPVTKRRRKLTTPVYFPANLDAAAIFGQASFASYVLRAVVLHSGTALGGHYRCLLRTAAGGWLDCNDASVSALSAEDVQQMFADPVTGGDADAGGVVHKGSFVHENAYMLLYAAADSASATGLTLAEAKTLVPASIQAEVAAENESFATRFRLQEIQKHLISLTVRLHTPASAEGSATVQLDLLPTTTLNAALTQAHQQFVSAGKLNGAAFPLSQSRLRRYGKRAQSSLGETFGGREGSTLAELGMSGTVTLALEVRSATDAEFTEFNPADMHLRVTVWSATAAAATAGEGHDVLVPGRETATVGALRATVAAVLAVDATRVVLLHNDPTLPLTQLTADDDTLVSKRIFPADHTLVVDIVPADADPSGYQSAAFSALDERRNKAIIYYNKPTAEVSGAGDREEGGAEGAGEGGADAAHSEGPAQRSSAYPFSIEVSLDLTLSAFKDLVAPTVGVTDTATFYCKRNSGSSAARLKDESKTLRELAFVNHSVIHLQLGQSCKTGEHMLRIEVDPTSPTAALHSLTSTTAAEGGGEGGIAAAGAASQPLVLLGELAVSEKATVLQLKQQLCEQWAALAARNANDGATTLRTPPTAAHIRLRDGKAGKISGPLRDDRIVGRCLLGLADGRRLVAQVLDDPEQIAADDLVVSLRVASFDRRILYPAIDLPITRSASMRAFYDKILALVPMLNEPLPPDYLAENPSEVGTDTMSLAKGFTTGPALTLKAAFKLKWDEPAVIAALNDPNSGATAASAAPAPVEVVTAEEVTGEIDEATLERSRNLGSVGGLDRPPLNLRDGSIVVVRSKADFWRATLTMKARKAAEEALGEDAPPRRPTTAGTGAAAARNRKSVKERVAAANAGVLGTASGGESGDEVLVKGAPMMTSSAPNSRRGGGSERGLKIAAAGEQ